MSELEVQAPPTAYDTELAELLDSIDHPRAFDVPEEPAWQTRVCTALAGLLIVGFLLSCGVYLVPAYSGVDQNGYLVGGRMIAENLSMRQQPVRPGPSGQFDPHQFVGRMWVGADLGTPNERYYPKYPPGFPLLVAIALWIGGDGHGVQFAYWINPTAMSLAVLGTYLLIKQVTRSFWALCGAVLFATGPLVVGLATNPNSHATAVCGAVWGMYLLLRWWAEQGAWRIFFAGFLLGYTCTIRYSEGLLLLPLLIALAINFRWREWQSWVESFFGLLGWLIPIAAMIACNYAAMGRITGYDGTNESVGFSLEYARENWETMLRTLASFALTYTFPFAVMGLIAMLWRAWRIGIVMAAWIIPCVLTYVFYYWAPDPPQVQGTFVSYMRFVVTAVPALILCACWLFDNVCAFAESAAAPRWLLGVVHSGFAVLILLAVAVQLQNSTLGSEIDQQSRLSLKVHTDEVLKIVPANAAIFTQDTALLHHVQFARDYLLYIGDTFNKATVDSLPNMDPDAPQGWEPGRRDALYRRLKNLTQPQLDQQQRDTIKALLDSGRRVFYVIPRLGNDPVLNEKFAGERRGAFPGISKINQWFGLLDPAEVRVVSMWASTVVRPPMNVNSTRWQRTQIRLSGPAPMWEILEIKREVARPNKPPTTQ